MADAKYGRLYTDADVKRVVTLIAADESKQFAAGAVDRALCEVDTTFPADEPLFLLRGQNIAAPEALGRYLDASITLVAISGREHQEAVQRAYDAMCDWQAANPDRVKVPD